MNGNKNKPDDTRKKQILEEYKNRRPEMGVIALTCRQTGESFLGASKNTQADFNSLCFKLSARGFPNRRLQELWNQYGPQGFDLTVLETLNPKELSEDEGPRLEKLRQSYLDRNPKAQKIWR